MERSISRDRPIVLINPPFPERTYPGKSPEDYLARFINQHGYHATCLDADIMGNTACLREIQRLQPALVGCTSLSIQIDEAMLLLEQIRQICPDAVNVLGGAHATHAGEHLFPIHNDYLDACVVGEGLIPLLQIAQSVEHGQWEEGKHEVYGLMWWDKYQGKVIANEPYLNADPNDYRRDLRTHHPSYDFPVLARPGGKPRKTFHIMTTFGCAGSCRYCTSCVDCRGGKLHTERHMSLTTIEAIFQEAKALGYEAVYFDTDTFTRDAEQAVAIARLCKKYGLVFGYHTRPDCESPELIRIMIECGCVYMFAGLESAVPGILLGANKTHDPRAYLSVYQESFETKKALGLPSSVFLIHGMPERIDLGNRVLYVPDSLASSMATLAFVLWTLDPEWLSMNVLRFIPGVPFSVARVFEFLRPVSGQLHGGYFDRKWLEANGEQDIRSRHPIYRAFEGTGSPVPRHTTPEYCYELLRMTVEMVNTKNREPSRNKTKVVVDPWFAKRFLIARWSGHVLAYELAPFAAIDAVA